MGKGNTVAQNEQALRRLFAVLEIDPPLPTGPADADEAWPVSLVAGLQSERLLQPLFQLAAFSEKTGWGQRLFGASRHLVTWAAQLAEERNLQEDMRLVSLAGKYLDTLCQVLCLSRWVSPGVVCPFAPWRCPWALALCLRRSYLGAAPRLRPLAARPATPRPRLHVAQRPSALALLALVGAWPQTTPRSTARRARRATSARNSGMPLAWRSCRAARPCARRFGKRCSSSPT